MSAPFTVLLRVRYGECDAQGVVFNARYGDYADVAITEFFRAVVGPWQRLLDQGLDAQVVRMATDWTAPARHDEVLALAVEALHVGTTSYAMRVTMTEAGSGRAVAVTELVYVLVDAARHVKIPVPEWLRRALLDGAPGQRADLAGGAAAPAGAAP